MFTNRIHTLKSSSTSISGYLFRQSRNEKVKDITKCIDMAVKSFLNTEYGLFSYIIRKKRYTEK